AGADFADPEGEIVRLLQGRAAQWLAPSSPVLVAGYTGWSDYLLAGDIAREAGRRVTLARLIGPAKARHLVAPRASAAAQNLLRTLCESCGDGGIAWILE
ncbi:MAG TPA: hypothetical protein VN222_01960, partial [Novosphingobium sp.]|nr:hypothetical protein [Novosphingobium sp.]